MKWLKAISALGALSDQVDKLIVFADTHPVFSEAWREPTRTAFLLLCSTVAPFVSKMPPLSRLDQIFNDVFDAYAKSKGVQNG